MNPAKVMRINNFVLDPNIYISYFISKRQNVLLEIATDNKLTFFICDELIIELKRVLGYERLSKYEIDIYDAVQFVKNLGTNAKLSYPVKHYIPEDPNDDYLIALALQTSSGYITTGDKDILSEKENLEKKYKKLIILTKAEFEKMFLPQ